MLLKVYTVEVLFVPENNNIAKKSENKKNIIEFDKKSSSAKNLRKTQQIPSQELNPDELIFALDIGTRTVVGIVGKQDAGKFRIISAEVIEHKSRAMFDGQIHDINQVAEVVREIKTILEKKTGVTFSKVAIAAAGRVLKTCEVKVERDIEQGREIDQELVSSIEIEAIQKAQIEVDDEVSKKEKTQYYCVGYSVINYFLNDFVISQLKGHRGRKIGVEVLATFLPHIVVDSLYTVMGMAGLEVTSLTLEPIAAINVTIPKDLRLLNLALVDIGAGTSDIAITRDGSVVAYAMAPIAGDEITEKIAQVYLVDFNTGERIKLALSSGNSSVTFVDILGKKQTVGTNDVLDAVRSAVEQLAETITDKILEYNHKAPNAVFLIGGGSQVPGLTRMIAGKLGLHEDRVVVRGRNVIQNLKFSGKKLAGPESITPIGIAITALVQRGQDFFTVTLNGKSVRLFNSKKLTVADALILVGYNANQLIGRSGKSVTFELNGTRKTVRGGYGKAAEISVNNKVASLDTVIKAGDDITVVPAEDGKNAEVKVSDIIGCDENECEIFVNGRKQDIDYTLNNMDIVESRKREWASETIAKTDTSTGKTVDIIVNGKALSLEADKKQYIFVDVFNHINFDLTKPQGNIVLRLNGSQAAFTDAICSGDVIDIYWEK